MNKWTAVVLAAGKGTRMKSNLPKVLHPVMGKPMVLHVVDKSYQAGAENVLAIVGFGGESVEAVLTGKARVVEQKEQLGTGHAVQQCIPALENYQGDVMILCGDTPLLRVETLSDLMDKHQKSGASATVLTALLDNPMGYGRILRSDSGQVLGIVEEKDATEVQRKVQEINTGIYCFKSLDLVEALKSLTNDNAQGEYYLTDTLAYLNKVDKPVGAQILLDEDESLGVNSRVQLAQAEQILRQRKNLELMENGVTLMDPATTYVDEDVEVGPDTVIYPSTWLEGQTQIGSN
ncbi:MAG: NTP transferase domain-containing protein, partial [Negativicutes bacterium]|nr:NTP transferase domain-containing protein [Negativicutes bacterium]